MKKIAGIALFVSVIFILAQCEDPPSSTDPIITSIVGQVTDQQTNEPLGGATITSEPPTSTITTDASGNYKLEDIESGNYKIKAQKSGFVESSATVMANRGKEVRADVQLAELKPELVVSPTYINFGTSLG
jgi:TolB protein